MNLLPLAPPSVDQTVPGRYRGLWARTLLETSEGRDTSTWVRWMQTAHWHADLRIPAGLDRSTSAGLARQQGFCGVTEITPGQDGRPEICTWQRRVDFQPPRSTPDAGHMVFETPDRVIETGVHGPYREVWERLPGSLGHCLAWAVVDDAGCPTGARLLLTGRHFMFVRPRKVAWPTDVVPDETLADLLQRHPDQASALVDFEIDAGALQDSIWTVERSTRPCQQGLPLCEILQLGSAELAAVLDARAEGGWRR